MTVSELTHKAQRLAISSLGILIIGLLLQPVIELTAMVPKNYNEGWNAFHSLHAMGLESLYPTAEKLFTNNYPPLSFYVVGGLGQLIGDDIFAGRLLALVSLLVVTINIFFILRLPLRCSFSASSFSALLFLGYMGTHCRDYVGMNDPQLMGHAMQTLAALVIWLAHAQDDNDTYNNNRASKSDLQRYLLWLALGLIIGSLFIKHNLLAFPITIAVWLLYNTSFGWLWLAMGLGGGSLALCTWAYGPEFISGVFLSSRQYELERVFNRLLNYWLYPVFLWIACGVTFGLRAGSKYHGKLLLTYFGVSLMLGAVIIGGQGVNYNALFDLFISLVLLLGVGLNRMVPIRSTKLVTRQLAWMMVLALPILLALPSIGLTSKWRLLNAEKVATAKVVQTISTTNGPVMCEMLSLCYWAGQPLEVDLFNTGQRLKTNAMEESHLISLIEQQHFALIQLDDAKGSNRLPINVNQAIFQYYQVRPPLPPKAIEHPAYLFYPVASEDL